MNDVPLRPNETLLAILATPATTSGARTLARINTARHLLGYQKVVTRNVLNVATFRTTDISSAGSVAAPWLASRPLISGALKDCDGVLVGYGVSEPSGTAKSHYRSQLAWLWRQLQEARLPVWSVGLPPRHPSRWQRLTHRAQPGVPFSEVLPTVLLPADVDWVIDQMGDDGAKLKHRRGQ